MVQEGYVNNQSTSGHNEPLITNDHYLLPLIQEKYAPKKHLSHHSTHSELEHLLEHYDHLCLKFRITNSKEKCKGLYNYCGRKLRETIRGMPSYVRGDFDIFIRDLKYFLREEDDSYNLAKVDRLTRKWRARSISSLEEFKRYHRKFLELVGRAIGKETIDERECNRHFWEGINRSLRNRIEERLQLLNPDLDVSVPFDMEDVIRAANAIFNRRRFDQHLLIKRTYGSDTDSDEEDYRPSHIKSDSEPSSASDSEDSDVPRKRRTKKTHHIPFPPKPAPKHEPPPARPSGKDEISDLTDKMKKLQIYLMARDPAYHQLMNSPQGRPPRNSSYNHPGPKNGPQFRQPPFNNPSPQISRPPINNFQPPRQPPTQFANASYRQPQRDIPPHLNPNMIPIPQESYCFGCGETGHRVIQCTEVNTLINQGTIIRNQNGKLCWPDGSYILRDRDETWVKAVNKSIKRANIVRTSISNLDTGDVYQYVGVGKDESDASSDEQEELNWTSGAVADCYTVGGVERNPRVSKDTRKQVQFNPPGNPQRMEKFPKRMQVINTGRQNLSINHPNHLNRSQHGNVRHPTPVDVNQNKFKGEDDSQFIPMEVDQAVPKELAQDSSKILKNQSRAHITKPTNPRPKSDKVSAEIIKEIMNHDVTVHLDSLLDISPSVRRALQDAAKVPCEASRQTQEKIEPGDQVGRTFVGSNLEPPSESESGEEVWESRDDLLTMSVRIGKETMMGVFDSGSQANIISEECAKKCGLPIQVGDLKKIKISGVDGGIAQCVGIIPQAPIYVTDLELKTYGKLLVVRKAAFKLLLGRPWGRENKGGIREASEGTYLSFQSGSKYYEINVSPSESFKRKAREVGKSVVGVHQIEEPDEEAISAAAVSYATPVPDSEADQDLPNEEENELSTPPGNQGLARNQLEDEEDDLLEDPDQGQIADSEDQSAEEGEEEDREPQSTLPESIYTHSGDNNPGRSSMTIDLELQQSFIEMVQEGIDEMEWNRFCQVEGTRVKEDKEVWKKWTEEQKPTPELPDLPPDHQIPTPDPGNPSETLVTSPPTQNYDPHIPKVAPPKRKSELTTARRSRRVKRKTKKAEESEFMQNLERRSYQRKENLVRQSIKCEGGTASKSMLVGLGTLLEPEKLAGDDVTEETIFIKVLACADTSTEETPEMPSTKLLDQLQDPQNQEKGEAPEDKTDIPQKEPGYYDWFQDQGKYLETTYQWGKATITERNVAYPNRTGEAQIENIRPAEEIRGVERLMEANKEFQEDRRYPSLTQEELLTIVAWNNIQPENQGGGKEFIFYTTDTGNIAMTMIGDAQQPEPRLATGIRVIEFERSVTGELREVPGTRRQGYSEYPPRLSKDPEEAARIDQRILNSNNYEQTEVQANGLELGRDIRRELLETKEEREVGSLEVAVRRETKEEERNDEPVARAQRAIEEEKRIRGKMEEDEEWESEEENRRENLREESEKKFPLEKPRRNLPTIKSPHPGILGALELAPVAGNDEREGVEFYAKKATIVWDDAQGRAKLCRGEAVIRMKTRKEPPDADKIPRSRINAARRTLFRHEDRKRKNDQEKEMEGAGTHKKITCNLTLGQEGPQDAEELYKRKARSVQVTREEMESITDELVRNPLDKKYELRTYEIVKLESGVVEIRRIPHAHDDARVTKETVEEDGREELERQSEDPVQEILTKKGNDPHPPDRRSTEENRNFELEPATANGRASLNLEKSDEGVGSLGKQVRSVQMEKDIKETRWTHLRDTQPPLFEHLLNYQPVDHPSTCHAMLNPLRTPEPPRLPLRDGGTVHVAGPPYPPNLRPPPTEYIQGYFDVPACPTIRRPGLVVASHMSRLTQDTADPRGISFFGYGSTIVMDEPDGTSRTYQGHALVHVFASEPPTYARMNMPAPPDRRRSEVARASFFRERGDTPDPDQGVADRADGLEEPMASLRVKPKAPTNNPVAPDRRAERPMGEGVRSREVEAAKILVSPAPSNNIDTSILTEDPFYKQSQMRGSGPTKPVDDKDTTQASKIPAAVDGGPAKAKTLDKSTTEYSQPTEGPAKETEKRTKNNQPADIRVKDEPIDDEMVIVDVPDTPPDSPPGLWYPGEDDRAPNLRNVSFQPIEGIGKPESHSKPVSRIQIVKPSESEDEEMTDEEEPEERVKEVGIDYREWRKKFESVEKKMRNGEKWESDGIREIFLDLGLFHWWVTLRHEMANPETMDWVTWKEEMVQERVRRYPDDLRSIYRWMTDDVEQLLNPSKPVSALGVIKVGSEMDTDVEMSDDDAPKRPHSTPNPTQSAPALADSKTEKPPTFSEGEKMECFQERLGDLENRVEDTTREIREKIAKLEHELMVEVVDLADLRWRTAELEEEENLRKTARQRQQIAELDQQALEAGEKTADLGEGGRPRRGKRDRGKGRTHRYLTRYAAANKDLRVAPRKRDMGEMDKRMRKMEGRVEEQQKEIARLKEELAKAEALGPQLAALGAAFEAFRINQVRINLMICDNFTRLRGHVAEVIEARCTSQAREIEALHVRYHALYTAAAHMFGHPAVNESLAIAQRPPARANPPPPPYPSRPQPQRSNAANPLIDTLARNLSRTGNVSA